MDTPILTANRGWQTMATVEPGDTVFAEDGSPTRVTHTSQVFLNSECYELTFADGALLTASSDHLWKVYDAYNHRQSSGGWFLLTTDEVAARWRLPTGQNRFRVSCDAVVDHPEVDLPVDPYIFGRWLGDGNNASMAITVGVEDKKDLVDAVGRAGYCVSTETFVASGWGCGWRLSVSNGAPQRGPGRERSLNTALRALGVRGSKTKFIPDLYLQSSPQQRRRLLAGLLDSDGSISAGKQRRASYSSTSRALGQDVFELTRSLGIRSTVNRYINKKGTPYWTIAWTPTWDQFGMARKSERFVPRIEKPGGRDSSLMSITDVRKTESVPTRCLAVAHDSHVFLVGRTFVPQHNTSLQVDSVFTSLRIICNSIIDFGNLRAYKTKFSDDNIPYRSWVLEQPSILEQTWVPGMQQYDGVERTVMSMGLFGEAFWFVVERDNLGYATALEVLHPSFMRVEAGKGGQVVYKYGLPNDEKTLDPDDVVHIPKMAMPGAIRGLSGIEYGQVIFAIALAAYEYGSRWFAQGASPSYLLSTKGKLNQAELTRIAEKFLFEHSGLQNSHLPMVVDNGMEVQKIQSTPDEAQFMQTLEFARSAIFDWFGIPLFLRNNALERNSPEPPGTISERSTAFLRFTLTGYTVPLQQAFTELVPSGLHAAYDTSEFTRADVKSLSAEITALRNSQVASVNDIRVHKLGWEPSEDPDADKVMLPLASNVSPQQTSPPSEEPPAEPEPDDEASDRRPMTLREAASALSDAASALTRVAVADSARHEEQSRLLVSAAATALTQAEARDRDVQRKLSELDASVETAA